MYYVDIAILFSYLIICFLLGFFKRKTANNLTEIVSYKNIRLPAFICVIFAEFFNGCCFLRAAKNIIRNDIKPL